MATSTRPTWRCSIQAPSSGQGNLTISGGTAVNSGTAPHLLELGGQAYAGTTTINNAVVAFLSGGTNTSNILPATTILNLVNNGWFIIDGGTSSQTVAGLTGDTSGRVGTTNGAAATNLTIATSAGQTYTFSGVIGALSLLNKNGNNADILADDRRLGDASLERREYLLRRDDD